MSNNRGGARDGAGRKKLPKEETREIRKLFRFNQVESDRLDRAVEVSGENEAEFVREAIFQKVEKYEQYSKRLSQQLKK